MLDRPEVVESILKRLRLLSPVSPTKYGSDAKRVEKHRATTAKWQIENPDKVREYRQASDARRRALKAHCQGSYTAQEWLNKKA